MPQDRVDFFVVGAQKAGTTALAQLLRRHPRLRMASPKEAHHFDRARTDWTRPDHAWLHDKFDWSETGVRRGEATPAYLYWPPALPRLQTYNSEARLIVGLRHPAFRAFSHWRMMRERGRERLSFAAAVSDRGRARVARAPEGVHRAFSYVERGLYAAQIARLLDLFDRRQVLFYRVDDLWNRPAATLARIEKHLEVEPHDRSGLRSVYTAPVPTTGAETLTDAARAFLAPAFAEDLRRTEALTGVDLADWMDPAYREPMHNPTMVSAPGPASCGFQGRTAAAPPRPEWPKR